MGASTFCDSGKGKSAREVFNDLKENAYYMHGHGGYTGTIAEKPGFIQFSVPNGMSVKEFINAVEDYDPSNLEDVHPTIRKAYKVYDDKWAPAVCVQDGDEFIFFGWASD